MTGKMFATEVLRHLLQKKADLYAVDDSGQSALHLAAFRGNAPGLKVLALRRGCAGYLL